VSDDGERAFTSDSLYGMGKAYAYAGALSFMRRNYSRDLDGVDIVVSGIPLDTATTNRPGARFGPRAIRAASTNLAWSGGPWPWGFDPFETLAVVDYGDYEFDHGKPAGVPAEIEAYAAKLLTSQANMLTMGGDHFITYPLLRAHHARYGPLSLVHFDAHSDTWREDEKRIDHGTMFFHAAQDGLVDPAHSVQIGMRTHNDETHGFNILDANWVHANGPQAVVKRVTDIVGNRHAYLTFDIDCLDPCFAPGTGTPVCGGLSTWQTQTIIRGLTAIDFVAMDLVEVAPAYDVGEITALAGASLMLDYICLAAARRRG
jgi:agmatinase